MPRTSIEALSELQQRGINTLKVAQNAQIAGLRAARETATTTPPMLPMAQYATDVAISVTYGLMAQQAAFAKRCLDAFGAAQATRVAQPAAAATVIEIAPQPVVTTPPLDSVARDVSAATAVSDDAVAESPAVLTPSFAENIAHDIISASASTIAAAEHLTANVIDAATSQIEIATAPIAPIVEAAATAPAEPIVEAAATATGEPIVEAAATATGEPIAEASAAADDASHELVTATSVPSFSEAAALNERAVEAAADTETGPGMPPEIVLPRKVPVASKNGMQPKRGPANKSKRPR